MRLALELLGGHVGYGSAHLLDTTRARTLGNQDKAEITEQDLAAAPQQHILRLDVAVNELAVMCVLQGRRSLLDVRNKDGGGQYNPLELIRKPVRRKPDHIVESKSEHRPDTARSDRTRDAFPSGSTADGSD